jgi:hypothetical protein
MDHDQERAMDNSSSDNVNTIRTRAGELDRPGDESRLEALLEIAQASLREIGRIRSRSPQAILVRIGQAPPSRIQAERSLED